MMSGSTGFHTDQASGNLAKEVHDLLATQLAGDDDLARAVNAVHLEHILGEINADGNNLHVDNPSSDSLFNDHLFDTFDAESGRRPPHQSRRFDRAPATSGLPR
jgi:hypothetical protein